MGGGGRDGIAHREKWSAQFESFLSAVFSLLERVDSIEQGGGGQEEVVVFSMPLPEFKSSSPDPAGEMAHLACQVRDDEEDRICFSFLRIKLARIDFVLRTYY